MYDSEKELVVLPWWSPLAKTWSEARPEESGEVLLRRQLRCVQRVVKDYFDEIDQSTSTSPSPKTVPEPRPAADDVTEDDARTALAPETTAVLLPEPLVKYLGFRRIKADGTPSEA
ncbi:hypothetical protein [Streptomyces sp. NPDC096193]|uniref:hypothetical protein n=1 Tax=Streptomyces sp. NPDC096193 TaxID=3155821 RepID=UPI00331A320A